MLVITTLAFGPLLLLQAAISGAGYYFCTEYYSEEVNQFTAEHVDEL